MRSDIKITLSQLDRLGRRLMADELNVGEISSVLGELIDVVADFVNDSEGKE